MIMSTKFHPLFIVLALLVGVHQAVAQGTQFFRIAGPAATIIRAFNPDGTIVWSNAEGGGTYTIQTIPSLAEESNWVDYIQISVTHLVNTNQLVSFNPPSGMAFIPAGLFTMGDTLDGETDAVPAITVEVSAFYMDVNLVNSNLWHAVYSYGTSNGYTFENVGAAKAANQPVQTVSWYDCVKWSNARSQQAGLTPVYYTDAGLTRIYKAANVLSPYVNWAANGYRLPTEAEWEKAARGGLSGQRFPWGPENTLSESQANYYSEPDNYTYDFGPGGYNTNGLAEGSPYTSPVGSFAPNGYGLYDMAGNLLEWCWDWYAPPPYPAGSAYLGGTDPLGPASSPYNTRVLRGGDWLGDAYSVRCACRADSLLDINPEEFGFRCVRGL